MRSISHNFNVYINGIIIVIPRYSCSSRYRSSSISTLIRSTPTVRNLDSVICTSYSYNY